jgi:NAD(P)-dependent dehydrogenase (short-subunit alcohol dehydrogenase family)
MGGYQASAMLGIYGSTKSAVEGLSEALYAETKPLGIHVTVVGPGAFRTDFLDVSSLRSSQATVSDYAAMRQKAHAYVEANNHRQSGDPAKLAKILVQVVALPDPPFRLPLGDDAVRRIESKNEFVAGEVERWRKRWPHSFGQSSEIFKWNVRGSHAANLIAGSVAKYASSGVRSSRLE